MAAGKFSILNMQQLDLGWLRCRRSFVNDTGEPVELPWLRLGIYSTALLWRKKYFTYEEQTMCVWLSDCTINCNFFEHVQRIKTEGVGIIHGLCREQRGHRLLFIIEITKKLFVNYLDESCRTSPDDRWCVTSHKDSTHYLIAPKGFISNFVTACSPWLIRPPFESIPTWTRMLACLGADEYYPSVYILYIQIDLSINLTGLWAATWFVLQNKHRNLMTWYIRFMTSTSQRQDWHKGSFYRTTQTTRGWALLFSVNWEFLLSLWTTPVAKELSFSLWYRLIGY